MQTKLTLRIESKLIEQAKSFAAKRGMSVSQLISDFFVALGDEASAPDLPPITKSLRGLLEGKRVSEKEYRAHLEKKHL